MHRLLVCSTAAAAALSASVAFAANPDPQTVDFPKNMEFAAQVMLLKADGRRPAHAPLVDDQPVQLRFDQPVKDTPATVPCTFTIPKKIGHIAAGESAVIGVKCSEVVYLPRDRLGFKVMDGGVEIGSGSYRP